MVFLATKAAVAATIVGIGVTFGALSYLARHRQGGGGNAPGNFNGSSSPASSGGAFPFPISFQKDSSQYPQSLPNLHFTLPRFNLSRLFGGGQSAVSDCNCKLIYDCSTFFGGASQSFRFRRTCGFQGFQRKICCDEGPFFSTPPPTVAFEEMKSVHAQLSSNCNHGLEGHSTTKCNCDEHRHLFEDSSQGDEGSQPEGSYRAIAGGISTDTVKIDTSTINPDGSDVLGQDENEKTESTSTLSSMTTEDGNRKRFDFPDVNEYFRDDKHKEEDQYQSTFLPFPNDGESVARIGDAFEENSKSTTMNGGKTSGLNEFFPDGEGSDPSRVLATTTLKSSPVLDGEIKSKSSDEITVTTLTNLTTENPSLKDPLITPAKINETFFEDVELPQGRLAPEGTRVTEHDSKTVEIGNADILPSSISDVTSSMSPSSDMDTTSLKSTDEEVINENSQSSTPTLTSTATAVSEPEVSTTPAKEFFLDGEGSDTSRTSLATTTPVSQVMEGEKTTKSPEMESTKPSTTTESSEYIVTSTMPNEGFTEEVELPQGRQAPGRTTVTQEIEKTAEMEIADGLPLSVRTVQSSSFPTTLSSDMENVMTSTKPSEKEVIVANNLQQSSTSTETSIPATTTVTYHIAKNAEMGQVDVQSLEMNVITSTAPSPTSTSSDMEDFLTSEMPSEEQAISETPTQFSTSESISAEPDGSTTPKAGLLLDGEGSDSSRLLETTTTEYSQVMEDERTSKSPEIITTTGAATERSNSEGTLTLTTTLINDAFNEEGSTELPQSRLAPGRISVTDQIKNVETELADVLSLSVNEITTTSPPSDMGDLTTSTKSTEEEAISYSEQSSTPTESPEAEHSTTSKAEPFPDGEENDPTGTTTTTKSSQVLESEITSKTPEIMTTTSSTRDSSSSEDTLTTTMIIEAFPEEVELPQGRLAPGRTTVTDQIAKMAETEKPDVLPLSISTIPPTAFPTTLSSEIDDVTTSTKPSEEEIISHQPTTTDASTTAVLEPEDFTTAKAELIPDVEESGPSKTLATTTTKYSQVIEDERTSKSLGTTMPPSSRILPEATKGTDTDAMAELNEFLTTLQAASPTPQQDFPDVTETIIHGIRRGTNRPQSLLFEMNLVNDKSEEVSTTPVIQTSTSVSASISSETERITNSTSRSDVNKIDSLITTPPTTDAETTRLSPLSNGAEGESQDFVSTTVPSERRPFALSIGESTTVSPLTEASQATPTVTPQGDDEFSLEISTTTNKPSGDEGAITNGIPTTTENEPDYDLPVNPMEVNVEQSASTPSTSSIVSSESALATPTTGTSSFEDKVTTTMIYDAFTEEQPQGRIAPGGITVTDHIAKNAEMEQVDVQPLAVDVAPSTIPTSTSPSSDMEDFTTSEKPSEEKAAINTSTQPTTSELTSTEGAELEGSATSPSQLAPGEEGNDQATAPGTITVTDDNAKNAKIGQVDVQSLAMDVSTSTMPSPTSTSSDMDDFTTSVKPPEELAASETSTQSSTSESISAELESSTTPEAGILPDGEGSDPSNILETTTTKYYYAMEGERTSKSPEIITTTTTERSNSEGTVTTTLINDAFTEEGSTELPQSKLAPGRTFVTDQITKNVETDMVDVLSLSEGAITTTSPPSDMGDLTTSTKSTEGTEPEDSATPESELLHEVNDPAGTLATTTTTPFQVMEGERTSKSPELISTTGAATERSTSEDTVTTDVTSDSFTEEVQLLQDRHAPGSATVTDRIVKNADMGQADVLSLVNEATSTSPPSDVEDLTTSTKPTEEEAISYSQQPSTSASESSESENATTLKIEVVQDEEEIDPLRTTTKPSQVLESEITSTTPDIIASTTSITRDSSSLEDTLTTTMINEAFPEEVELPQGRLAPGRTTVTDQIAKPGEVGKADVQPLAVDVATSTIPTPTSPSSDMEDFTTSEKPSKEQATIETTTQLSPSESTPTEGTEPEGFTTSQAELLPDEEGSDPLRTTVKSSQVPEGEIASEAPEMTTTTKMPTSTSTAMETTTFSPPGKKEADTEVPTDETSTMASYQSDNDGQDDEDSSPSVSSEPLVHSMSTQEPETTSEEPASTEQSLFDDIMSILSSLTTMSPEESSSTSTTTGSSQETTTVENIAGTLKIIEVPVTSPTTEKVGDESRTGSEITTTTLQPSSLSPMEAEDKDEEKAATTEAKVEPTTTVESFTERSTEEPISTSMTSNFKLDIEDGTTTATSFSSIPLDGEGEIVTTTRVADVTDDDKISDEPSDISSYSTVPPSLEKRMEEVSITTESAPNMEGEETSTMNLLRTEEIRHQQTDSPTPVSILEMMSGSTDNTGWTMSTKNVDKITTTEMITEESSAKDQVKAEADAGTTTEVGQSEKSYFPSESSDRTTTEWLEEFPEMDDEIRTSTPYSHGIDMETLEKATELSAPSLLKLNDTESADYTSTMNSISSVPPTSDGGSTTEQPESTTTSTYSTEEETKSSEASSSTTATPTTPFSLEGWSTTLEPIVMNDEEVDETTKSQDAPSKSTSRPQITLMSNPEADSSTTTEPNTMVMVNNSTKSEVNIEETTMMSSAEAFKAKGVEVTTNVIISSTLDSAMNRILDTTTSAPMTTEGSSESTDATEESGIMSRMEAVQTSTTAPTEDVDDSISTTVAPLGPAQEKAFSSTLNSSIDETATSTLSSDMEKTTNILDMETTTESLELPQPRIAPSRIPASSLIQIIDGKPPTTTTEIYHHLDASTTKNVEKTTTASEMSTESDMSTTTTSEVEVDDLIMGIDLTSTPKEEETTPSNTTDSAMEADSTTAWMTTEEPIPTVTPSPNETHAGYGATTEYPDPVEVTLPGSESVSEMPEPEGAATTPSFTFVTTDNPDFDDEDGPITEITKSVRREPDTDKTIVRLTSMTSTVRTKIIKVVKAVRSGSESSISELTTESPSTTERTTTEVESTQEPTTERRTTELSVFDDEAVQQTTENEVIIRDDGTNVTQNVTSEDIPMERITTVENSLPTTESGVIQIVEVLEEEALQNETTEGTSKYDFIQPTTETEGFNDETMQNSTETGADYLQETTTLQGSNLESRGLQDITTEKDNTEAGFKLSTEMPISTEREDDFMETTQKQNIMEEEDKQQETTIGGGVNDFPTDSPKQTTEVWTTEGLLRQTTDTLLQSENPEVLTEKTDADAGTTTTEKEPSSTIPNLAFDEMDVDGGNDTTSAATTWPSSLEVKHSKIVIDLKLESTTGTPSPSQVPSTEIPASTEPSTEKAFEFKTTSSAPDSAEVTSETTTENGKGLPETSEEIPTSTFNPNIDDKMIVDSEQDDIVDFDVQESSSKMPEDTTEGTTTVPNRGDEEYSSSVLEEVYDAIFGPSGRSARVNNLGQSGKSPSTISTTSEAKTTTTPPPPFKLEVKIGPYNARSLFSSDSTSDEKQLAGEISNVVSQLLLTTHKNFHLLPNFIECAGARARTGRRKTKVLHFDTDNYPWMARVGFREPRGILFPCAGTIISRRYILTSAHCATRMSSDSSKMEILLEGAKLAARGMSELEQSHYKYAVDEVILHQNYDKTTRENDLALIRLSKEIPHFNGSSEVKPICLPFEDGYGVWDSLPEVGETAYLGGWGYGLKNMAAKVEEMEEAAVTIWPNQNCTYLYRGDYQKKITPQHICAYGKVEKDACRGDFGGPLMALMTRQRIFFQIGIVSYGPRCGYGVPGVYTRVSDYLSWILDSMRA